MLKNKRVRINAIKQAEIEELTLLLKLEKVRKRLRNLRTSNEYDISREKMRARNE